MPPVPLQSQACLSSARTRPAGCCWGQIEARMTWNEPRWPRGWRPNAAGAPATSGLLELGSNSTSGALLGQNRCTLDLAGAPKVSCWAVQQRRRPRMLTFGSNLTGGVLVGSNVGTFDLARAAGVSCRAAQCCARPRKLECGSNLTGGCCWGGIVASSTWRDLRRSRVGRSRATSAPQAQVRIESDRWMAARVESWQTRLGASSEGPERSSAAGPPRKLAFGWNSTVGVLSGSNCGMLDLARALGTSWLAAKCRRRPCNLRLA